MKQPLKLITLLVLLIFTLNYCSKDEELPPNDINETGLLSLNISLEIEELPAARIAEVNTDNFIVTIHKATDGSELMRFDPFSSAPAEIELVTGEYFVRATNLEPPANAAFDLPWYFGESEVFNIDKEELKPVDLTCALANYKVSFVYSQNVLDNFTDWNATAALNTTDFLIWPKGETREGYFVGGPLDIEVYLEYTKVFTGELITRTFNTTIDDPQPATLYRINIDATLEDGKIVININVDDSFDVIDIDLGENNTGGSNNENWSPGQVWSDDRDGIEYKTVEIGSQIWMAENLRYQGVESWWYNNDADIGAIYGRMYEWQTALNGEAPSTSTPSGVQGVCPAGWHLPSVGEWSILINSLGGQGVAGGKLKQAGTTLWNPPNLGATNESGFNGLPSGWFPQAYGASALGILGGFTTTSSSMVILHKDIEGVGIQGPNNNALAIRCVKD